MKAILGIVATLLLAAGAAPSFAEITSLSIEDLPRRSGGDFAMVGTTSSGDMRVITIIHDPAGNYKGQLTAVSNGAGEFRSSPKPVSDYFEAPGTYTVTAFLDDDPNSKVPIEVEYNRGVVSIVPDFVLDIATIPSKSVEVGQTLSFTVGLTDRTLSDVRFSLATSPAGATINQNTGAFRWTPTESQGTASGTTHIINIMAVKDGIEAMERVSIMVSAPQPAEQELAVPAPFYDETKGAQHYIDRYAGEESYREWFDANYPEYDSIYHALGVEEPLAVPAPFYDETKGAQHYIDRYAGEESYREWFDANYPEYDSIYHALGVEEPQPDLSFVDAYKDPRYYIHKYSSEASYAEWFDANYPGMTIHEAVGLEEPPELAPFVDPAADPQSYIDRYAGEESYREWFDANYPGMTIHEAVGLEEPPELAPFVDPAADPQSYIDRYAGEESYREWFDANYPGMTIHEAVGLEEPLPFIGIGSDPQDYIDSYAEDPDYMEWFDGEYGMTIYEALGQDAPVTECDAGFVLVDGTCTAQDRNGCLIATATYGSEMAPQVQMLREIRDGQLMLTSAGSSFMESFNRAYYSFSPHMADYQRENPAFNDAVRLAITPLLATLSLMEHADSEAKVLGYGTGVILLNLAIYLAAPAALLMGLRRLRARRPASPVTG